MITKTIMTLGIMASFVIGLSFSSVYAGLDDLICDKCVDNSDMAKNAIKSKQIKNSQVKTADIKDGTITSADLAPGVSGFTNVQLITSDTIELDVSLGAKHSFLHCPDGTTLTGGGIVSQSYGDPSTDVSIVTNGPLTTGTWNVAIDVDAGSFAYKIQILCAS